MKPLTFKAKDIRLVKDIEVEFPKEYGIVLIKGKNNTGKSTFIQAFSDLISGNNTTELADGVTNGYSLGQFELPSGEVLTVRMDMSENKIGSRFVFVDDKGLIKKKVSDISDLFKYNPFTIEEFIEKGKYAEGRRWQRNIFLDVLGDKVKKEFIELEANEEDVYKKRTDANNEVMMLSNVVDNTVPPTESYTMAGKYDELVAECKLKEEKYLSTYTELELKKEEVKPYNELLENISIKKSEIKSKLDQYKKTEKSFDDEIADLESKISAKKLQKELTLKILKEEGENLRTSIASLEVKISTISSLDISKYIQKEIEAKNALFEARKKVDECNDHIRVINTYEFNRVNYEKSKQLADELDKNISDIRLQKEELVIKSKCPIKDIRIVKEGLEININNKWLPLDVHHVSQSRLMFAVARINVEVNKNLPITLVSRGESLDKDMLKEFAKFAKQTDSIFLIEKVDDEHSEIQCEIIIE